MAEQQIRFDDGASYEQMMGIWSRLAGEIFLDWLAPPSGMRWINIGCGNGAFTELLVERCAPSEIVGIDPSEGQHAFARTRPASRLAEFRSGDAMALPFPARRFDAAVMALVIVFVPQPAKGIDEMVRIGRPERCRWRNLRVGHGGWRLSSGPDSCREMRAMGLTPPQPPQVKACQTEALRDLWTGARARGCQDANDHGAPGLCGFRRILGNQRKSLYGRLHHSRNEFWRSGQAQGTGTPTPEARRRGTHRLLR